MTDYEGQAALSAYVRTMTIRIDRHADAYAHEVADYFTRIQTGAERPDEQPLLDSFNAHVEKIVADYDPTEIGQRGDSLVFAHIYATTDQHVVDDDELRRTPIESLTALLAAEVEFRGPRKLSRTQNMQLAENYEWLGHNLAETGLPGHAALAFLRAAGMHALNEDVDAQDRCGLALARARRQATYPPWRRSVGWASDLLCGYGYRPFRLLGWIAGLLVVFTFALYEVSDLTLTTSLHYCLLNFLNPVGLGDLDKIGTPGRVLLVTEAYAGIVSSSVFFALLVRRWFRL